MTPIDGAETLASALEKGVLMRVPGSGHTAFGQGDTCVDDVVLQYLISLSAPVLLSPCPPR